MKHLSNYSRKKTPKFLTFSDHSPCLSSVTCEVGASVSYWPVEHGKENDIFRFWDKSRIPAAASPSTIARARMACLSACTRHTHPSRQLLSAIWAQLVSRHLVRKERAEWRRVIAGTKVIWGETDQGAIQMFKVLAPLPQMHTYVNLLLLWGESLPYPLLLINNITTFFLCIKARRLFKVMAKK